MTVHLPVADEPASSLHSDGRRNYVHPADVAGRFTTRRSVMFVLLCTVYLVTPFLKIGGKPAVFFDVLHRRFHLLGATFNANDFWLVFFLLTGLGFALILLTTLFGRVWCGYACPQTVFMEGIFRRIERLVEGPRNERMKRNAARVSWDTIWRKGLKHIVFFALCAAFAHVFLSYFVSLPSLLLMVRRPPGEHFEAFTWIAATTAVTYLDFAWFREQVCLIVCPYGRLQSAMTDRDTVIIGYDSKRGEPRGKATTEGVGDCIDCRRCVQVCPTGIDIRNGLQLDCIGCAACVDACDEVMDKVGRDRGLVRYDSLRGFDGGAPKILRPRVFLYAALGLVGLVVAGFAFRSRVAFEGHLLRTAGAVFVVTDEYVGNPVRLHVVNKRDEPIVLTVENHSDRALVTVPELRTIRLGPGEARYVGLLLRVPRDAMRPGLRARFTLRLSGSRDRVDVLLPRLGPVRRPHG
jgi:cytochrome c oxidase accessory protein FixG